MSLPNEKTTAPCPAVGAAGEQSNGRQTKGSITENAVFIKGRSRQLDTISMVELYDTTYPPKAVLIQNLLYAGTYLFVGAPKVGKSFFMAQLSHHIATGKSLWQFPVNQGEVLYLALEDDRARIQKRLYMMFGTESTEHLHFATQSMTLSGGLCQQLEDFVAEHTSTRLIIVDTLQKVREVGNDKYSYYTQSVQYFHTTILQEVSCSALPIDQVVEDRFFRTVANVVHSTNPCHLITLFQLLVDAFLFCQMCAEQREPISRLIVNADEIAVQSTVENKLGIEHRTIFLEVLLVLSAPSTNGLLFHWCNNQIRQIIISLHLVPKTVILIIDDFLHTDSSVCNLRLTTVNVF